MKKLFGAIPLLIYVIEALFFGFFAFLLFTLHEGVDGSGVGGAIFESYFEIGGLIFGMIVACIALIPLLLAIFKGIHLATGAGFFGVICVIADIATGALFVVAAPEADLLFPAIVVGVSLLCNIFSLGKKV